MMFLVNYWMRGHPDYSNKDYVLGGNYETIVDADGIYKVVMKLDVKLQRPSDFGIYTLLINRIIFNTVRKIHLGIYKCIAKNALGNSEEIIKVLRKFENRIFK